MRGVELDGGEEVLLFVLFDERQGAVHDDAGVIATHVIGDWGAVLHVRCAALPGVTGFLAPIFPTFGRDGGIPSRDRAGGGEPGVVAVLSGRRKEAARTLVLFLDPADVPFPEEAGLVVLGLEHFGARDFADAHSSGMGREDAEAEGVAPGEAASASG